MGVQMGRGGGRSPREREGRWHGQVPEHRGGARSRRWRATHVEEESVPVQQDRLYQIAENGKVLDCIQFLKRD